MKNSNQIITKRFIIRKSLIGTNTIVNVEFKSGSIMLSSSQQDYDLQALWGNVSESGNQIEVRRIFNDATTPNSCSVSLFVRIKAANPEAVVRLVSNVILPIFCIIICNAISLLLVLLNSLWNLLIRKMQFGIPITIITGGTRAIKREISYPNNDIVPKQKTTPNITTSIEDITALNDLKNKNSINEVISKVRNINKEISFLIFKESTVLI